MIRPYEPDRSLKGKLRRRLAQRVARRPATSRPERGMVSFSFDDAPVSAARSGAEILQQRGLRGTWYIAAGLFGAEGHMGRFTSAEDVARLRAAGHEIGCHSFDHIDCARARPDELAADLERNAAALGGAPETFAYPYGEVGFAAKRRLAERYALSRGVQAGLIRRGSDLAQAPAVGVEGPDGEEAARRWIVRAAAECAWLILFTHDVREAPSEWGCSPDALSRVVDFALAQGLEPVTVAEGARRMRGDA